MTAPQKPPATSTRWWQLLLLGAALAMPGCSGCNEDPNDPNATAEAKEKAKAKEDPTKKEKPTPDFEPVKLFTVPQRRELALHPVKPGHWTAAVEEMKANNFDFVGELYGEVLGDGLGKGVDLERTPHRLAVTRPAPLPKGQPKFFEMLFFVPRDRTRAQLATELRSRGGGLIATPGAEPLQLMKAQQYFLVALAAEADRYRPLAQFDCVRAPNSDGPLDYYQVITPQLMKPLPVPNNALAWSSIAYVVWDDVDPQLLSAEQRTALVDWLHWGGQLIVSGPKSLDALRDKTFLGNYLPALPGEPVKITAEMLAPLNDWYTLPVKNQPGKTLAPVTPWSGITLQKQGDAKFVDGTGELVVERQVGRGRIVATAFRLTERQLWNWPSFDGFWNACLLRRPARKFEQSPDLGGLKVDWALSSYDKFDPRVVTQVRFLSRDWTEKGDYDTPGRSSPATTTTTAEVDPFGFGDVGVNASVLDETVLDLSGRSQIGPGIAAWSDFSAVSNAARDSLKEAAGIVIPKANFVMWTLGVYLVVLVPLNFMLFWGLGKLEWAWIAAPLIALVGTTAVVKLAQLDIGFARSETEIAVLETHAGYPRGHLTRYTALYTSLSTTYDVAAKDPTAVILPFAADPQFTPLPGQSSTTVTYHGEPNVQLTGFGVLSNSTAMLHSEQMCDLGGPIELVVKGDLGNGGTCEVINRTGYDLKRAAVLRRSVGAEYQIGWVGDLAAGRGTKVTLNRPEAFATMVPDWSFNLAISDDPGSPQLSLDRVADLVRGVEKLQPTEVRLVGLIEKTLPGLTVDPSSSQRQRGATLVVAHLKQPGLELPVVDRNTRRDVTTARDETVFEAEENR